MRVGNMKQILSISLVAGIVLLVGLAEGQIKDDDSSKNLLAMQCSMSSGLPPSNYEEYCNRLAKTVGLLAPAQQQRVFGYLPRPGYVETGDFAPSNNASGSSEGYGSASGNTLVDIVGDFNDSLRDNQDKSGGAIIGGAPPEQEPEPSSNDKEPSWWDGFLDWFGELLTETRKQNSKSQSNKETKGTANAVEVIEENGQGQAIGLGLN